MRLFKQEMAAKEAADNVKPISVGPTQAQRDAFYEAGPKNRQATLMGTETATGITPERRKSPFGEMKAEAPNVDRMQSEGLGIGMMQAARALLKNPSFSGGIGDALGAFADQGLITKKELRDAKKDYRDFNLNSAKAEEAFQQGQDDLGQKYKKMAQDKELGLAQLAIDKIRANKPDGSVQLLQALGDPKLMERYKEMQLSKRPTDVIARDKALTQWEDLTKSKQKQYGDFETYYKTVNNQLLSATIPGEGANIRSY
jgi:hypothetical protein